VAHSDTSVKPSVNRQETRDATLLFRRSGQTDFGGPEEDKVLPAGGRPPDAAGGVQLLEEQQVLQPLVFRELHPGPLPEESSGHPQADAEHHGQVGRVKLHRVALVAIVENENTCHADLGGITGAVNI